MTTCPGIEVLSKLFSKLLLVIFLVACFHIEANAGRTTSDKDTPADTRAETTVVHLYFGAENGNYLRAEQRSITMEPDEVVFGRKLLKMLVEGPRKSGRAVLPETTRLRTFFIKADGTAYIDFESPSFKGWPFSAISEFLAVYSLVDTLIVNLDKVDAVKIMLDGKETMTLAGHADLSRPLVADMMWVR